MTEFGAGSILKGPAFKVKKWFFEETLFDACPQTKSSTIKKGQIAPSAELGFLKKKNCNYLRKPI